MVEDVPLHAATLRYFESDGPFAAAVTAAIGRSLPAPLMAAVSQGLVLAWLRPTETLALSEGAAPLADLKEKVAQAAGGHVVDLTGGLKAFRVRGARGSDLLGRLGSAALALRVGEARRGRLADVPVLAICVRADETLLVVERIYAAHLRGWIAATVGDWEEGRV
jgi:heterotetrameric sarcosine oxidase gamma subunit